MNVSVADEVFVAVKDFHERLIWFSDWFNKRLRTLPCPELNVPITLNNWSTRALDFAILQSHYNHLSQFLWRLFVVSLVRSFVCLFIHLCISNRSNPQYSSSHFCPRETFRRDKHGPLSSNAPSTAAIATAISHLSNQAWEIQLSLSHQFAAILNSLYCPCLNPWKTLAPKD